jgi:hypothetical protein
MSSNSVRKRVLVLLMLVLPLALAAPVLAAPPTTEVVTEDASSVDTELCGFPITFHDSGTYKITTFYDKAGNPVKSILTNFNDRFVETATANGKTLLANYPTVFITALPSEAYVQLGLRANYTVPGTGVVALDAGHISFDSSGEVLFEAGPHDLLNGSADAFCDYFAA